VNPTKSTKTLLVIDDDKVFCYVLRDHFSRKKIHVLVAHSGTEGLAVCQQDKVDIVLLDQKLPDVEGHTLCPSILEHNDQAKIIFITAHPSFENAVNAIRSGAYDYLSKPFEVEALDLAVERAFRTLNLERIENLQAYKTDLECERTILIGGSGGLGETVKMANLAASVDSPVLITGETGTGKNVVAGAIHYRSPAAREAFVSVNCASLSENLIEAELFGYEKGAFTGAVIARKGIFEMAEGGTLLLDEIGEIPLHLKSKLLSVLEDKKIRRLGGNSFKRVDVRVIASTSVPLESVIGTKFRKDLYYRLNVVRIHIPPLRERRADIPELCRYLLKEIAAGTAATLPEVEIAKLKEYDWPGNVRELRNVLERAFILQKGPVLRPSEILVPKLEGAETSFQTILTDRRLATLSEMERNHIKEALDSLSYNYTQTARSLGISLSTLKRKIREYHLK
jgi:DNA-binding NtrC family response regulator